MPDTPAADPFRHAPQPPSESWNPLALPASPGRAGSASPINEAAA
ncbi:hypothetical protein ACFWTE_12395 [Nocardiopsis sp. NPDC058631]